MKNFLKIFIISCPLLFNSCSENIAPDGSQRGVLINVNEVEINNKQYTIFFYNRFETIDSESNGSASFGYSILHTVDTKTGKRLYESTMATGEGTGTLIGMTNKLAIFTNYLGEFCAMEITKSKSELNTQQLINFYQERNSGKSYKLVKFEVSGRNLRAISDKGDMLILNVQNDKFELLNDQDLSSSNYEIQIGKSYLNASIEIDNQQYALVINDTLSLYLTPMSENNSHKKNLVFYKHPSRKKESMKIYSQKEIIRTIDKIFIDSDIFGYKDSICYISGYDEISNQKSFYIGAFNLNTLKFNWKLNNVELLKYLEQKENLNFKFGWGMEAERLYLYNNDNKYEPTICLDMKNGKLLWKY